MHSDQLNKYKKLISCKNKKENENRAKIKTVYYKIYDENNVEKLKENGVNVIFERKDILKLSKKYENSIDSVIFKNYYDYLSNIENDINSYKDKKLEDWNSNCYIGFFKELKREENCLKHAVGRENDCGWGYVIDRNL